MTFGAVKKQARSSSGMGKECGIANGADSLGDRSPHYRTEILRLSSFLRAPSALTVTRLGPAVMVERASVPPQSPHLSSALGGALSMQILEAIRQMTGIVPAPSRDFCMISGYDTGCRGTGE